MLRPTGPWSGPANRLGMLVLVGVETAFPEADTALESLRGQLELQAAFFRSSQGNLIRSLVAEAQSDPELATAFRDHWLHPRREGVRRIMRLAVKEGSLRSDLNIEAAIDLLYGALYYRLLLGSASLEGRFVKDMYRQFLEGHATPAGIRTIAGNTAAHRSR